MIITGKKICFQISLLIIPLLIQCLSSCHSPGTQNRDTPSGISDPAKEVELYDKYPPVYNLLILPENPAPGEPFRILAFGGENILKAKIKVSGPAGVLEPMKRISGDQCPYWRIDDFSKSPAGNYKVVLTDGNKEVISLGFILSARHESRPPGTVWKTVKGWDSGMEALYSAWINALFYGCNEDKSWSALHEVIRNKDQNFLYNFLSLEEDDSKGNNSLIMQPDCADNPFFLRAYFSWKLGLPFGYHICDRGNLERNPRTSEWITNESSSPYTDPVHSTCFSEEL